MNEFHFFLFVFKNINAGLQQPGNDAKCHLSQVLLLVLIQIYCKIEKTLNKLRVLEKDLPRIRVVQYQILIRIDFSLNFEVAHVKIIRDTGKEEF